MGVFESLLNNTFVISRRTRTFDGQGGWIMAYLPLGTIKGRLRPATSQEREVAALEERYITHVFYCVEGEDIARGDTLSGDDITVDVMGVREPSRADHHLEVDCAEQQPEVSEEPGS